MERPPATEKIKKPLKDGDLGSSLTAIQEKNALVNVFIDTKLISGYYFK